MTRHCVVAALAGLAIASAQAQAFSDLVTIGVSLDFPSGPEAGPYRRLTGQSVFFSTRTNGLTTGGQLDGVTSFDSENQSSEINYVEVFPETNLTDYLQFGYFGVVETVDPGDGSGPEVVTDRSLVVAGNSAIFGQTVEDIFGVSESVLVNALTTQFDSPEFFAALNSATNNPDLRGDTWLVELVGNVPTSVRNPESLGLFAFYADPDMPQNPDSASSIGFLDHRVYRVPSPSAALLLGLAGLTAGRRRR